MPANSGSIAGTVAHQHDSDSANGGFLLAGTTGVTNMSLGSIGYYDASSVLQELTAASDTDVLTLSGGLPSWASTGEAHTAGQLTMWGGDFDDMPTGWLLCDGSSISTTTYAGLYAKLGVKFGNSGGAGTFDLPNFTSVFPTSPAAATSGGGTGGANNVTLTEAQMPDHTHVLTDPGHTHSWAGHIYYEDNNGNYFQPTNNSTYAKTVPSAVTGITIANTGGSTSFDNRPTYLEVCFIIKT